ncbi:MAG TPA: glycosyltransferase family 39 protein [Nannocystaceae bacterium]|nr:glycosyltransferase family 39 protein [Nannocystaceae bacterium]
MRPRWVALALGLVTVVLLALGHRDVGYARDEGIYFSASRSYAAWLGDLARDPGRALAREGRDRRFRENHEHPALLKLLAGASARLLAHAPAPGTELDGIVDTGGLLPVMPEGTAMRLPAQIIAGLGVALLYVVMAARAGPWAGLLAAGGFALLPHVAFHAGLHAFDVPVAVAMLVVVLVWRRALVDRRAGVLVGVALGIAIAVKHNALFLGPLLAVHYYGALALGRWRHGLRIERAQLVPLPLVSMAVIAPLVAFALWPWLWGDPWARVLEYVEFHRQHAYYNMEFLGRNYNQPPMPISYPAVMTWATVPTCLLVLALVGAVLGVREDVARGAARAPADQPTFARPLPDPWCRQDALLFVGLAVFPLALISLPSTPIFGGTKHWITAYPFVALLAADAWTRLWTRSALADRRRLEPAALVVCLGPAAMATIDGHPYGISQYAPMCGGARGAAELGLNRGFWGTAIAPALPGLATTLGGRNRIYVHDLHEAALLQYRREGRWPEQLVAAPIARAQAGLLFHELHMATYEFQLWDRLGTTAPAEVIVLDGVPLTSIYVER